MTLFELEGIVSLNTEDVFSSIDAVNVALDELTSKMESFEIGNLFGDENTLAGSLANMIGTVLGGELLALGSELSFGNIGIHIDIANRGEVVKNAQTLYDDIAAIFSSAFMLADPTFPKVEGDFLDTITEWGEDITKKAIEAAAWEMPSPDMPSVSNTVSKIQSFWEAVKSQLDLSVTATVNIQQHGGGAGKRVGSSGGGGIFDWATDILNTIGQPITNLLEGRPMFSSGISYVPEDNYLAYLHRGEIVLPRQEAEEYRASRSGSGAGTTAILAEIRALGDRIERMSINMDGDKVADIVTDRVSSNIAREAGAW